MKNTHTPGPWIVQLTPMSSSFCKDWREIYSGNTPVVSSSSFTRTAQGETYDVCGVRITEADARLIAASPVLLSQLRCIEEVAAKNAEHLSADWCVVRDLARAAIRKAEIE